MSDELTEEPLPLNPLPAETRQEAREKRTVRHTFARVFGKFAKAMMEAMDAYLVARKQGMDRDTAIKGLESVIRETWPRPVTKFGPQCLVCDDIGYEEMRCRQWARCLRDKCNLKGEAWEHNYVVPCQCVKGDKFRARTYQADEATAGIGKVAKKRGGFSRMGT